MAGTDAGALETVFDSQQMQRSLHEAAWAARVLLHLDASVLFLKRMGPDRLSAAAWHGREAGEASISSSAAAVKALWAGRRSISWDRRERCPDPEMGAILDSMGLTGGLVVPFSANSDFIGVWLAATAEERAFDQNDELIMSTLAENIGLTTESLLLSAENLRYRREADALYEIGKEISQLMDLDAVLRIIAQKTCALLNAEISYIALADNNAGEVRVRVTEGARNEYLRSMVLKYGEGVGGYVANTRRPLLINNYPDDSRPKPPGIAYIAATEDIISIISVPMVARSGLIGVLFAASRRDTAFNFSQVDLLSALGTQAAIAIENARLYEEQKVAAAKMRTAVTTHEQLLNLVLGNQGLQAIADTLSELVHCPVAVKDGRLRTVCASLRGFSGAAPEAWHDADMREWIDMPPGARHTMQIPASAERRNSYPRTVAPIVAGANLLGYVLVLELGAPLNEQQRSAIEQGSIVLALEFMKQDAAQSVEQRLAGDLLDDLLFGRGGADPSVYQRAARFKVDLRLPQRVIVVDVDEFAQAIKTHGWNDMETLAIKRRLMGTVGDVVRWQAPSSLIGTRGDSVLLVAPERQGPNIAEAKSLGAAVQQALAVSIPSLTVSVGIGRVSGEAAQLPRSYDDALTGLRSAQCMGRRNCVVAFEELGVMPLLLQSQDQQGLLSFMERYLRPLLDYDQEHKAQLVTTLESYLGNSGNLRRTAETCHVHLNSLKYRMRRIREISGLDLDDGATRFNLHLALSIRSALNILRPETLGGVRP